MIIEINDVEFEVEFSVQVIDWVEGNQTEITIFEVVLPDSPENNLLDFLSKETLDKIEEKIIKEGKSNNMEIF